MRTTQRVASSPIGYSLAITLVLDTSAPGAQCAPAGCFAQIGADNSIDSGVLRTTFDRSHREDRTIPVLEIEAGAAPATVTSDLSRMSH